MENLARNRTAKSELKLTCRVRSRTIAERLLPLVPSDPEIFVAHRIDYRLYETDCIIREIRSLFSLPYAQSQE